VITIYQHYKLESDSALDVYQLLFWNNQDISLPKLTLKSTTMIRQN